nr:hypothetical protein [Helicobacter pylori]
MFYLDWLELSQEEIQKHRDSMDYNNELLQLDYSLKNLLRLKGYKENNKEFYQECLNDEELQNNLREWRGEQKINKNNNKAFNTKLFESIRAFIEKLFESIRAFIDKMQ